MKRKLLFILLLSCINSFAQKSKPKYKDQWLFPPKDSSMLISEDQQAELLTSEEDMQWYKDAKFGVFVHWGPALLATNVLSWGRHGNRPAANKAANKGVPAEEYDELYKHFNPVNFDADEWMKHVKDFGAEYLVFTAKHHDGFCFFDAKNTEYNIMNTPYGKDICKQLADAAHKHGVKLFWYYSQPDWHHPDCLREKHYENYLPYMNEHIEQLFSKYGRIDGVFWDGLASKYWQWDSYHLIKKMKEWQPGLINNPRSGFSWPNPKIRGDFDTPEQSLGPVDHHRYWEACLTMTDKWLYSPEGPIKSTETVTSMLIQVVCNGGNLLLNFGPDGKGEFVQKDVEEAKGIGEWLDKYGESIYGTRRGVYIGADWGGSTQKDNVLYLHFMKKATTQFELPVLQNQIVKVEGLTKAFKSLKEKEGKYVISFDKDLIQDEIDHIVKITFKHSLEGTKRIATWNQMPIAKKDFVIHASSERNEKNAGKVIYSSKENTFSEGIRLKSWWEPTKKDKTPSLTLKFKSPKKVNTVLLSENMRAHNVKDFVIEVSQNGKWKTVHRGSYIGEGYRIGIQPEEIDGIRLLINTYQQTPQITAFNVYEDLEDSTTTSVE
ncbi:alpha-L-fucosidase [Flammeovirga yaeyamensis]|uniref:alpha-L-fucosidase n=1 Tax=Flammeovirga yaeyamensis TaxID=367791 RepID=A0AAX1NBS2_9BACT|nr:alpha-L-fucosidase [Flammeovirga yaeyamensis]MBB3697105.1 alpha-L-fucosidase [Flammeovirga yaeyamensis]NMF33768.1 hypothetical protein [Flammeovirga yaeyamensis]QWG04966.1 alpha-L-fucosidase [Flammeovirga yaeyamensis]